MKKISIILLLMMTSFANANQILIFGTKEHKFYNKHKFKKTHQIKHYLIDSGRDFEKQISKGLSKDPKIAMQQVQKLFNKNKKVWEDGAKKSFQGAVNAQSLNIQKVPAITFDNGKTVIYGVLNLSDAYQKYKNWSKKNER
jgi:integrating conjugative element protein (TIGR03757 family)